MKANMTGIFYVKEMNKIKPDGGKGKLYSVFEITAKTFDGEDISMNIACPTVYKDTFNKMLSRLHPVSIHEELTMPSKPLQGPGWIEKPKERKFQLVESKKEE